MLWVETSAQSCNAESIASERLSIMRLGFTWEALVLAVCSPLVEGSAAWYLTPASVINEPTHDDSCCGIFCFCVLFFVNDRLHA